MTCSPGWRTPTGSSAPRTREAWQPSCRCRSGPVDGSSGSSHSPAQSRARSARRRCPPCASSRRRPPASSTTLDCAGTPKPDPGPPPRSGVGEHVRWAERAASRARPAHRKSVRRTGESTLSVLSSETSTKSSSKGRLLAVLIGLIVGVAILYAVLVALSGGGVPRGTSALGVALGGLTPAAAQAKLDHAVVERGGRTVTAHAGDQSVPV